jgi:hypothetical protein
MNEEEYVRGFYDGLEKRYSSNTAYSDGFKAGQRNEREYLLSFIEDHEGIPINLDDIIQEIEGRYKREQNEVLRGLGL